MTTEEAEDLSIILAETTLNYFNITSLETDQQNFVCIYLRHYTTEFADKINFIKWNEDLELKVRLLLENIADLIELVVPNYQIQLNEAFTRNAIEFTNNFIEETAFDRVLKALDI